MKKEWPQRERALELLSREVGYVRKPHGGKLRIALVLSAIEGHDVREVAALLRLPDGTVKSRLFLARKALAEKLQWLNTNR